MSHLVGCATKDNGVCSSITELELLDTEPFVFNNEIVAVEYKENIEGIVVKKKLELRRIAFYSEKHKTIFIY